ncbi:hypothetical protein [Pseudactinotalea terrae]|uniref:hypothetical protein n=1 Tax=Pseudactinotalea terrae TaxID=1743262 RepID=UPI0012E22A63|nr:hypothetical protein [Pseudactinotalea terrae]
MRRILGALLLFLAFLLWQFVYVQVAKDMDIYCGSGEFHWVGLSWECVAEPGVTIATMGGPVVFCSMLALLALLLILWPRRTVQTSRAAARRHPAHRHRARIHPGTGHLLAPTRTTPPHASAGPR